MPPLAPLTPTPPLTTTPSRIPAPSLTPASSLNPTPSLTPASSRIPTPPLTPASSRIPAPPLAPAPNRPRIILPHGGYRRLKSYQTAEIIADATVGFCDRLIDRRSRTHDQMVQAARSGKQNIAEGSAASGTSKKTELKLVGVARASLEELLLDYQDFLRQRGLRLWEKDDPRAAEVRALAYKTNRSYRTYKTYVEDSPPESAANTLICLIHQANFLLDRQLRQLENCFLEEGGFTERLYRARCAVRR